MNGILIIDKPQQYTSFDVVAVLRKLLHVRRIGHTGTLDPMATGVLPVLLGPSCRANELLPVQDKEYIAGFALGKTSDTEDVWGNLRPVSDAPVPLSALEDAADGFRGDILQTPPMVSAIKKDGKRLYELARAGVVIEREARPVTVHTLTITHYDSDTRTGNLLIRCSKGTYVRSLISGMGDALGVGGIMTALRRTMAAGFTLDQALPLADARALGDRLSTRILPVETGFETLPVIRVSENQAKRFSNGGALDLNRLTIHDIVPEEGRRVRVQASSGLFLGLGAFHLGKNELAVARLLGGGMDE